jgi:NAD(P)-dependent dehydrogenase (short-subunit alcohol dehydrogenase family)
MNDYRGKAVLITGGTMGIGLATGLAFARAGAICWLTYKWGTAGDEEVLDHFVREGLPTPRLVNADVAHAGDTDALLEEIKESHDGIEAFVSNVSSAMLVRELGEYKLRGLQKSLEYSAWPMFDYTLRIKSVFGRYPRYVVGVSSGGPDSYHVNYDFVAAAKSLMETLSRYMNYRLRNDDVRVNVVRPHLISTKSLSETFGSDFESFLNRFGYQQFLSADEVGNTIFGLCSGYMDAVSGQVITIDRGITFLDTLIHVYAHRDQLDLSALIQHLEEE